MHRELVAHYAVQFQSQLHELGIEPTAPLPPAKPKRLPTAEEVAYIAQDTARTLLAQDEAMRAQGVNTDGYEAWAAILSDLDDEVSSGLSGASLGQLYRRFEGHLAAHGLKAPKDREELRPMVYKWAVAQGKALKQIQERVKGEPVDTPEPATEPESLKAHKAPAEATSGRARGPRLQDVIDYWKKTGEKSPRTVGTADTMVKEFKALHGDLPLDEITKAHFVALRDSELARVKPATVQARFNLLKAAYTVCLEDDQLGITSNPLQFVKIRNQEAQEKPRDAFNVDQLQALFDSEVFTAGARPVGGRGHTSFWAPLIALHTGARLDEILSLRVDGVHQVEGSWVFHFRHRPELGQHLKGKAKNERRVPVHPELIRLGLLDYLRAVSEGPALADGGPRWFFPDVDRSEKVRNHSSAWGAWFGRYLKGVGIKTDKLTFHSFRHTFKHFSRASGIPEDHHDAMTGHTTAEVARRYGSCAGYPVDVLVKSMSGLAFGSLNLSRVRAAT